MVLFTKEASKILNKKYVPKDVVENIFNSLMLLDSSKNFDLFDITEIVGNYENKYYRIRKGKYRAIFFIDDEENIVIEIIAKREDIYKIWKH